MIESVRAVLARVQSDYDFYVECQRDPDSALAGYDLTPDEVASITDPGQLELMLDRDLRPRNIPSITVKISGRHDWVNRTPKKTTIETNLDTEVAAIRAASSDEERKRATLDLIERIG